MRREGGREAGEYYLRGDYVEIVKALAYDGCFAEIVFPNLKKGEYLDIYQFMLAIRIC